MKTQRALGYVFVAIVSSAATASSLLGCSAEVPGSGEGLVEEEIRSAPPVLDACPRSFEEANGAACKESLSCLYSVECGATPQQTRCECTGGKVVCHDRVGEIPKGEKQLCAPGSSADMTDCPVSRSLADGASCNVAGRICAYRGRVCHTTPGVALLDWCRCSPDGDGGYKYNCGSALCPPEP